MAPLTKDFCFDLEGVFLSSDEFNADNRAAKGDCTNNESQDSYAHDLLRLWFFASCLFIQLCALFSSVIGTLPTAILWLEGVAVVVMVFCYVGLISAICTANGRGIEESLNELLIAGSGLTESKV
jgi:hypothetical protein